MRVLPELTPYSGTVGGGLTMIDEKGRARFMVLLCGTTDGITKEETEALATAIKRGIREGVEVPPRRVEVAK